MKGVPFKVIAKTDEAYFSTEYGCIRFIGTMNSMNMSLNNFVQTFT